MIGRAASVFGSAHSEFDERELSFQAAAAGGRYGAERVICIQVKHCGLPILGLPSSTYTYIFFGFCGFVLALSALSMMSTEAVPEKTHLPGEPQSVSCLSRKQHGLGPVVQPKHRIIA